MSSRNLARTRAEMPPGSDRILHARSLASSQRRLASLVRSGMRLLDVGCGTGAITRDIADAVGPEGLVVGVDIHDDLLRQAVMAPRKSTLHFVRADLFAPPFTPMFDIVTAARVLQWVDRPRDAVNALASVVKASGTLLVLDYNHEQLQWSPTPPASMQRFYAAFLRWRADAGMDNAIADHLAGLFESAGLVDIQITPQHEQTRRQDPDFPSRIGIWAEVAATRGHQMVADGAITAAERSAAEIEYRDWIETAAETQTLYLLAVEGRVSAPRL